MDHAQARKIKACFSGSTISFVRYHRVTLLGLLPLATVSMLVHPIDGIYIAGAVLMGVLDLPAVILCGLFILFYESSRGNLLWDGASVAIIGIGIFAGHYLASALHNAVHGNFRPRWLNRPIGELTAFVLTYGYGSFRAIHQLHHCFTDQELDPHSPRGKTLVRFALTVRRQIFQGLKTAFTMAEESDHLRHSWTVLAGVIAANRALRLVLLIVAFGPRLFLLFFVPCYVVNFFLFTFYNYKMHISSESGGVELQNLNQTFYQRWINWSCHGVLHHRNHHLSCHRFDPRAERPLMQAPGSPN